MKREIRALIMCSVMAIAVVGCGGDNEETEDVAVKEVDDKKGKNKNSEKDQREEELIRDLFSAIPSPLTMAFMLKEAGADYEQELVHNPEMVSDYLTQRKQALNLGIYGADMNFSNLMDRKAETIRYMGATLALYEKLGISNAVDERLLERMQSNQDQKDSMMILITDSYSSLEGYLKENGEVELAAYIMAGGVVEALYIASHVSKGKEELAQRVADQKFAINSLVVLLNSIGEDNEEINAVLTDIVRLKTIYDSLEVKDLSEENKTGDDGVMVIGAKEKVMITDAQLEEIGKVSGEIREKYIAK